MAEINNLNFGYKKKETLFSELNLELKKGRIYGLLGKNGSGKTTLLKQIAGLLHPQSGTVSLNDEVPQKRTPKVLASYYMIPEEFETPGINVKTFLKVTAPFYPGFKTKEFYEYLEEFKINTDQKLSKSPTDKKRSF